MTPEQYAAFEAELERQDNKRKASYAKRYNLTDEDIKNLHMAFSPRRIPRGLTKLQVRRRINRYLRQKETNDKHWLRDVLDTNSFQILINGKQVVHASFKGKVPDTHRKLQNFVKSILWDNK